MILLIGASASGKTEIAKLLQQKYGIKKVVTTTTRKMRVGEKQNVDYHFVGEEEFLRLEKEGAFVETAFYNGKHYGSSKKEISKDKVLIVEPKGSAAFIALHDPSIVSFYLYSSESSRENRMRLRGDSEGAIASRLENDRRDFNEENLPSFDYRFENENESLDELTDEIYKAYSKRISSL